jgi:electron transport complex protein RnfC
VTAIDILDRIRAAGIVGLGGAAFPTWLKLTPRQDKPVRHLLVNGCECEPFLTADARLMIEAAPAIVMGTLLAGKAARAYDIVIAVEDNKPEAIAALRDAARGVAVRIDSVKTKYPMGGERQVIPAVYGRPVPTGGLPLDIGIAVINVSTAAAIAGAVIRHEPLTHRVISVTGPGIWHPRNLLAPIGMSFGDLIACCGGFKSIARRVIAGGPMMGFAAPNLDVPLTKGTSGIVVLDDADLERPRETTCLRCGRCVDTCPLNLVPARLAHAVRHRNWDLAKRYHLSACMECGCCAYSCPAGIPLVQLIRTGKAEVKKRSR